MELRHIHYCDASRLFNPESIAPILRHQKTLCEAHDDGSPLTTHVHTFYGSEAPGAAPWLIWRYVQADPPGTDASPC